MLLKAPKLSTKGVVLEGRLGGKAAQFQIDTGASLSCISEELVAKLGLKSVRAEKEQKIEIADGKWIQSKFKEKFLLEKYKE